MKEVYTKIGQPFGALGKFTINGDALKNWATLRSIRLFTINEGDGHKKWTCLRDIIFFTKNGGDVYKILTTLWGLRAFLYEWRR